MIVTNDKRREVAAKVRETMGELGQVELDGIPLADLIEPEECDGCEPGAWEVVAMEVAERLGVAVGGCLPSDYADAIGEALDRRLMPEGYEWPRFEDGEPVRFLDDFERCGDENGVGAVAMCPDGSFSLNFRAYSKGERVRRPAPKALDADGVEIRVGDEVWTDYGIGPFEVTRIVNADRLRVICDDEENGHLNVYPQGLTHRALVFAADGKPLREGETVWHVDTGHEYVVVEPSYGDTVVVRLAKYDDAEGEQYAPDQLTHQRPDSWERLEDDATRQPYAYCVEHGLDDDSLPTNEKFACDLVRRAKALAERGE